MPDEPSTLTGRWPPPGFRRFWVGETASGVGSWVSLLALQTIVAVTLDGGATEPAG